MPKMNLVRKGLVNTRGLMPRWTNPNLFGHYKHLTGKYTHGDHAANYYLRPMSAYITLSKRNRREFRDRLTPVKLQTQRTVLRMKRKGKMANIYKSNNNSIDSDFYY